MNREFARYSVQPDRTDEMRDFVRTLEVGYWGIGIVLGGLVVAAAPMISHSWINAEAVPEEEVTHAVMLMGALLALQWPLSFYQGGSETAAAGGAERRQDPHRNIEQRRRSPCAVGALAQDHGVLCLAGRGRCTARDSDYEVDVVPRALRQSGGAVRSGGRPTGCNSRRRNERYCTVLNGPGADRTRSSSARCCRSRCLATTFSRNCRRCAAFVHIADIRGGIPSSLGAGRSWRQGSHSESLSRRNTVDGGPDPAHCNHHRNVFL